MCEKVRDNDLAKWRPEGSAGNSRSDHLLPNSHYTMMARESGNTVPAAGDSVYCFQYNAASSEVPCLPYSVRFAPRATDHQQFMFRSPDNTGDTTQRSESSYSGDGGYKTDWFLSRQNKRLLHTINYERDYNTLEHCFMSDAKPRAYGLSGVVDPKLLKVSSANDSVSPGTADCLKTLQHYVQLQTNYREENYGPSISKASERPVFEPDRIAVNGYGRSAVAAESTGMDIPMEQRRVVFDASNTAAFKRQAESAGRLEEFRKPVDSDVPSQWGTKPLDVPQIVQMSRDNDGGTGKSVFLKHMEWRDDRCRTPVATNSGISSSILPTGMPLPLAFTEPYAALNGKAYLPRRPNIQVFSDISDDDDVSHTNRELTLSSNTYGENNRLLPRKSEVQLSEESGHTTNPTVADDEESSLVDRSCTQAAAANQNRNVVEYEDGCENAWKEFRSADHQNNDECLSMMDAGEKDCNGAALLDLSPDKRTEETSANDSDDAKRLRTSGREDDVLRSPMEAGDSAVALEVWDIGRMKRRRRTKSSRKTLSDVVEMLRRTHDVPECDSQPAELGTAAEQTDCRNAEEVDREPVVAEPSPEPAAACEEEPSSPLDEAPPLLAITDFWKDGANATELSRTEKIITAASVGYDSDDAEAAMPVIEDMRSLLPTENQEENGMLFENGEEGTGGWKILGKTRKTSKPRKREVVSAVKDAFDVERTRALAAVCDRCTFSCSTEESLHRHVKVCHRTTTKEPARYVCTECATSLDDLESFLDHLAHHPGQHPVRYYMCSHCGADAVDMETMEQHVASSHEGATQRFEVVRERVAYLDNLVNCPLCGAASRWKKNFVSHIREHHQLEQFAVHLERGYQDRLWPEKLTVFRRDVLGQSSRNCLLENGSSSTTRDVSRYRDLCFNSSSSVIVHICCRCTFSTDDLDSYLEHYAGHFSKSGTRPPKRTNAPKDSVTYATNSGADQEPRTGQPGQKSRGQYACHLCPFKTPKRMFYHRHMAIHERNDGMTDGFRCGYCQFAHPRMQCITFHLGRYHGNRPTKVIRISGGVESEICGDGQGDADEDEPAAERSTGTRSASRQVSGYGSLPNYPPPFAQPPSFNAPQKPREFASDRVKRLNEFERRLPPSMFYQEPVKCPLCTFTNNVRINLIRHLRTHKNDDEEQEDDGPAVDNQSRAAFVADFWQNGAFTQRPVTNISANTSEKRITSSMIKQPHLSQPFIDNCLVSHSRV